MSRTAFRLCLRRFQDHAFSGEGARRAGGRWNPKGISVVYVSSTLSLAALEFLVHFAGLEDVPELVAIKVEFHDALVTIAQPPSGKHPAGLSETRRLGRDWVLRGRTPVLEVPSFVVPSEKNFVLNPASPRFAAIKTGPPEPFVLDARLYRHSP